MSTNNGGMRGVARFMVALYGILHSASASVHLANEKAVPPAFFRSPVLDLIQQRHPRQYAVFHLHHDENKQEEQQHQAIEIDGILNETAWEEVPFSDPFMDISGPLHWSQPWFCTKIKMRYDHQFLYIGAYLEDTAIWANETKRNAVIFHDNDFEVFVDADGSTHNYKEIEINAQNATWNLWLNKPYRSGGHENSTRVDKRHGFDMYGKGFRSAVHMDGRINDPAQRLHFWTVEMALPLNELAKHTRVEGQPIEGAASIWRINFSRVQWQVQVAGTKEQKYEKIPGLRESNWVWSPQYAVDMHRPEWWGYLHFRAKHERPPLDPGHGIVLPKDPYWPLRFVAFQFFYAQELYKAQYGVYSPRLDDKLSKFFMIQEAVALIQVESIQVSGTGQKYQARLQGAAEQVPGTVDLGSDSLVSFSGVGEHGATRSEVLVAEE